MDLRKWYPDERLIHIYSGVAKCLTIWDGYKFPGPATNLSSGASEPFFDITLFPIPVFVNFYSLNETTQSGEDDEDHQKALWCGPAAKLFAAIVAKRQEAFQFKMIPIRMADGMALLLSVHFAGLHIPFPQSIYPMAPVLRPTRQPLGAIDAGQLFMKRRYVRRDLAFLQSFTDVTWSAIAVTLLGVSLVASLLYEVRCALFSSKRGVREVCGRSIRRFISALFLLSSLMLAESSGDVDWMNSLLLALWLLAATILSGCMNVSMRDLMSAAAQELVPQTYDDIWTTEPFASMTLWAATFLPTWPTFRDAYREQIDERLAAGKMHLVLSSIQDIFIEGIVERELNTYITSITVQLGDTIFLSLKYAGYSVLWGSILYERPLVDYISRTDELLVLPADEKRPLSDLTADERLTIAQSNYLEFWNGIYDLYCAPTAVEELMYMPVSSFAPARVVHLFDTCVEYFTEYGDFALTFRVVDQMEAQFFKLRHGTAAYEDLLLLDFNGPLMCYAVIIAAAMTALLAELWWFHKDRTGKWWTRMARKRLKLKRVKVYPLADGKVCSHSKDPVELFTKSRSKMVTKRIVIK